MVNEYQKVSFAGAYDNGEYLYVSNSLNNGILKLNKKTGKAEYIKRFPGEKNLACGLHSQVYRYDDTIIFTPNLAAGLHIYSEKMDVLQNYPLDLGTDEKSRCIDSFLDGDKLWLFFSNGKHLVVVFDLISHTYETIQDVRTLLPEEMKEGSSPIFMSKLEKVERKIYGVIWGSSYIMQFDMDSHETEIYALTDVETRLTGIAYDGEYFWLTEADRSRVTKWTPKGDEKVILTVDLLGDSKGLIYCNIVCHKEKVILIPNMEDYVLYIDKGSEQLGRFCKLPEDISRFKDIRRDWRRFIYYDIINNEVLRLYPVGVDMMVDINLITAESFGQAFFLDDNIYKQEILYEYIKEVASQEFLLEKEEVGLDVYLDYLSELENSAINKVKSNAGTDIWNYVVK